MFGDKTNRSSPPPPVKGLFFLAIVALCIFLLGNAIVFLWNNILAEVTGVKTIRFWQAIGLFVLARLLFGGFHFGARASQWKERRRVWKEKWMQMSEEERAAFKNKWKERCKQ